MGKSVSPSQTKLNEQEKFLNAHGWAGATRSFLPGDFSARHYVRLDDGQRNGLLMVMPRADDLPLFLAMQSALDAAGIRVPGIYAVDPSCGFAIIEDLGNQDFNTLLRAGKDPDELYAVAIDALHRLHQSPPTQPIALTQFTPQVFLEQVSYFLECYAAYVLKKPFSPHAIRTFHDAWAPALDAACSIKSALMLRDFHAANIMYLEHETGHKKAAMIDFQDGGVGPISYDLASLLEDARLDIAKDLCTRMLEKYLSALPSADHAAFMTSYHVLACQRHMRILGILVKRWSALKQPMTQEYFVRVWQLLECHRTEPLLAAVYTWLDEYIPLACRKDWTP